METQVNYTVNCWDIWLLCNIDGTGPLWAQAYSLIKLWSMWPEIFHIELNPQCAISDKHGFIFPDWWYYIFDDIWKQTTHQIAFMCLLALVMDIHNSNKDNHIYVQWCLIMDIYDRMINACP